MGRGRLAKGENSASSEFKELNEKNHGQHHKPKFADFTGADPRKYESFKERVELYFDVEPEPEDRQAKVFLANVDPELYERLRVLVRPAVPKELSLKSLFEALDGHFVTKVNRRAERFKFNRTKQEAGESIADYLARLREAAKDCKFGEFITEASPAGAKLRLTALEDALLDRFVMGIRNVAVQQRLLETDPETLLEAVNLASTLQMAIAEREAAQVQVVEEEPEEICAVNATGRNAAGRNATGRNPATGGGELCHRCGNPKHELALCPGRNVRCRSCGSIGHFAKWCKTQKVQTVASGSSDPLNINLKINNHPVTATLDTGACKNLISPQHAASVLTDQKLTDSNCRLNAFAGQKLNVVGRAIAPVAAAEKHPVEMEFEVVDTGRVYKPLIGRPGLDQLFKGWREFFESNPESKSVAVDCEVKAVACELLELRNRYPNVFDGDLTQAIKGFKAEIHLKDDHPPLFTKPYSIPLRLEEKVKKELSKLVEVGILKKLSPVEAGRCSYASPIVAVMKSDGQSVRICIDCKRTINKYIINNSFYPLPNPELIFAKLGTAKYFCTLDLKNAYQQLELSERSKEFLTINTPFGLYRYNKLPFGVSAAPSIFQYVIDQVLQDVPFTQAYLDDIIIGGETEEECRKNLIAVLDRLSEYNVKVNGEKCELFKTRVHYLGHILSNGTISVNGKTWEAVEKAQTPSCVKEVQAYLGLINYFRNFAPSLSQVLHPLFALLKKGAVFHWTDECEKAFQKSKLIVTSKSCLEIYRASRETLIWCDASPVGLSAVLVQKNEQGVEVPVCFASCTLSPAQKNYAQLHREGLAVIYGVKKYYRFVCGRPFTIVTDANSIKEMFSPDKANAAVATARIQRWGMYLAAFDYNIIHRSSSKMGVPDALSRLPLKEYASDLDDQAINMIGLCEFDWLSYQDVDREAKRDPVLKRVTQLCLEGFDQKSCRDSPAIVPFYRIRNDLALENGLLFYRNRIVVPAVLRSKVLEVLHEGHQGMVLMKRTARSGVYWPNIDKDIEGWVNGCEACQAVSERPKQRVLSTWPPTFTPFERVHVDFGHFQGKTILVLVDVFSKYIEARVMNGTTAEKLIDSLEDIFRFFGYPSCLVCDNGPPFNSYKFTDYCKGSNIVLLHSPAYHPESNGSAEAAVKVVKTGLKKLAMEHPRSSVDQLLKQFLATYLDSSRSDGGGTPLERLFLYKPRNKLDILSSQNRVLVNCNKDLYEEFVENQPIYYRNNVRNSLNWVPGTVIRKTSQYIYDIMINEAPRSVHVSTLRRRSDNDRIGALPSLVNIDVAKTEPRRSARLKCK